MDPCCLQAFVDKGFLEWFKLAAPDDRFTCPRCQQAYQLVRVPDGDTPTHQHYEWRPVTH